jgi:hypothetical protein
MRTKCEKVKQHIQTLKSDLQCALFTVNSINLASLGQDGCSFGSEESLHFYSTRPKEATLIRALH